ncbi:amino acid transporter, putative [Babesia caballi]|uniref:Amino acid transporter, putative n=1 Tax=Babesia caballi TaxID=5871 RepID=A0AAV4LWE5_BABCB|nr:amino acid transporter, putative [Babesia caballi]
MCVAFPTNSGSIVSDILFSKTSVLNQTAICLFVAVCVVPDVVFGGISTKYNLLNLGYCGAKSAYFWGCVLPFMFSWLLSNESYFLEYLGHIGLISALFCDFVIPVVVYKVASQGFSGLAELSPDYSMADRGLSGASDKGTSGNAKGGDSAEEAMVRRGTSIWFSKLGTLGRAITVDFLRKSTFDGTVNEETAGATSKASSSMSSTLEAVTEEEAEDLDYLQFKIIRPPPAPREEDHLYNVLRTSRRTRHACFDPLDMPDSGDEACDISTSSPLKRTPRSQRVEVFPIDFLEKRSALSAHVMLVAIGLIVVLPALFYAKS